ARVRLPRWASHRRYGEKPGRKCPPPDPSRAHARLCLSQVRAPVIDPSGSYGAIEPVGGRDAKIWGRLENPVQFWETPREGYEAGCRLLAATSRPQSNGSHQQVAAATPT